MHTPAPSISRVLTRSTPQYLNTYPAKELSASTTFKNAADGCVDFGTRLFLRTEKGLLESTPQVTLC